MEGVDKKTGKQPVVDLDEDDDDDMTAKRAITRWNRNEEILLAETWIEHSQDALIGNGPTCRCLLELFYARIQLRETSSFSYKKYDDGKMNQDAIGTICVKNGYHGTKGFLFYGTVPIRDEEFSDVEEYNIGCLLIKILKNTATPSKDTEATSSSMVNITPLVNGSRAKQYWKLKSDREARLEEYGKRLEDHWSKLEAIRILEEDHVHEPEPECDDEDNCYECFDYDDLHLAYPAEKSPKWNF
ncbi:hypothetical protein Tco_1054363 [Tanacetum coccineum]|uniref:Uncharacterized protein n=1 Tax=Tanacetum coccineum TaxID=301880 RepID=A0ABQ5GXT3_9ASTR